MELSPAADDGAAVLWYYNITSEPLNTLVHLTAGEDRKFAVIPRAFVFSWTNIIIIIWPGYRCRCYKRHISSIRKVPTITADDCS